MFLLLALLLSSSSIITKNKVGGVCDAFFILSSSVSPRTARYHNPKTSIAYNNVDEEDEEPRAIHKVLVNLPLGIVLEEETGHDGGGVVVVGINDNSNTAKYNSSIMSKVKEGREQINCQHDFICIRDKIISVNDNYLGYCHDPLKGAMRDWTQTGYN